MTDLKRCSRCKKYTPLTNFHKSSSKADGLQDRCQDCRRIEAREYYKRKVLRRPDPNTSMVVSAWLAREDTVDGALLRNAQIELQDGLKMRGNAHGVTPKACAEALWAMGRLMGKT